MDDSDVPSSALVRDPAGSATHVRGSLLLSSVQALLLRTARRLGVSPWTVLDNVGKIWGRVLTGGGGARVRKLSQHSARCKLAGLPILDIPYLRNAWRGAFVAALEPFCSRVLVTEIIDARRAGVAVYGITWT